MPTTKPRISITVDAHDLAVLDRYAAASGTPRASMIAALIHATVPELERAAELIELANAAPRKVVQGVVDNLSNATADAMGFLEPFRADFHQVMASLQYELRGVEPVKQRKPGDEGDTPSAGRRGPRPPSSRREPPDPHLLTGGSKR
ncbi:MAG TPA: hypothetical protein VNT52_18440 [Acidimicrobiales bacterium]|nr:hypothetical protein [Acidimicrobiales bacterium]